MKPDSPILTIAIPTYNRAAKLQAQLERLVPQLCPEVCVRVFDNASPDHTREVAAQFPGVSYFRAVTNCGAGRNFFRCFEECQTEWLWILSDDDPASASAITDLLAILENQTADFIHTSTSGSAYAANTVVSDFPSLLRHTSFTMLNWVSGGVYRIPSFQPFFRLYNESVSVWCPHCLMILALVETQGGKILLSHVNLMGGPGDWAAWSTLDCIIRICHAPEYLAQPQHQKMLAQSIFHEWFYGALLTGLREVRQPADIRKWKRIYRQADFNLKSYQAQGAWLYFLLHGFRPGCRRQALRNLSQALRLELLRICPPFLFHALVRVLPLPGRARQEYNRRHEYKPSA
jgi:glycosyltransferase involved in cell wall biosynthesis